MNDTSQSMADLFHHKMAELSSEDRFLMGVQMFESAREIVLASLPPGLSPAERLYNIFIRYYGREFDAPTQEKIKQRIFQSAQAKE